MAGRNTEIRVGIAVILALVVVVWGVTWLSDTRLARSRRHYVVRFPDVGGLAEGDPVTVSGVNKGKVDAIALVAGGAAVTLSIDRAVVLTHGSRVFVRNTGLMGEKFIAVDPVSGGIPYGSRDTIPGTYESGVPEVISQMGTALTSLQRVSDQIDRILALAEDRGTLRKTLRNVEDASTNVSMAVSENRRDLREVTENLREMSHELRMLVAEKSPVVDETVDRLATTSTRIDTLVTRLDGVAIQFSRLATKIESDTTTVGAMLADRNLYDDLRRTLREVNTLVRDVKTNPRRYLKFSLF